MKSLDPTDHASHPGESRRHLPGLDGVRGLAILMVMLGHFIVVGKNLGIDTPIGRLLRSGHLGVDLFFVLSGFLITGILIDSKKSPNYFRVFYMRRALRIFPLYYGLLAVSWLTVVLLTPQDRSILTGADSMAWYWLYASNIGMAMKGDWLASPTWIGLGHFWSLAVEEQFYLFWPLLVYLIPTHRLKLVCAVLVIASPLVFAGLSYVMGDLAAYVSTMGRLGVLAAGGWMAIVWREPGAWPKFKKWLAPCAIVTGTLLLLERSIFKFLAFSEPTLALLLGSALVGLAASGTAGALKGRFFESAVLRWLGKYSYGIYVYHHALKPVWIYYLWEKWITHSIGTGWLGTFCYTAAATVASLVLAWLSWTFFEGPILTLKSRFAYWSRTKPSAGVNPSDVS